MTMIDQEDTVKGISWNATSDITKGPITALVSLENITKGWTNVNNQTYTLGKTSLSLEGAYTGCSTASSCTTNIYTLSERTAKARLITIQEAYALGCTVSHNSCPKWIVLGSSHWTSSVYVSSPNSAYYINHSAFSNVYYTNVDNEITAHAVVVVSK